jgi:hypothetical protein
MALTNPINKQNVINRFSQFVTAIANANIIWGTNSRPSIYFTSTYIGFEPFGGTTSGKSIAASASSINDVEITASTIYRVLVQETQRYSNIRNLRAQVNVTGTGLLILENSNARIDLGPITGFEPGLILDETQKAHLSSTYLQVEGTPNPSNVVVSQTITAAGLENFFTNLQTLYNQYRDNVVTITANVCHSSCHNSCHAARSRR